MPIVNQFVPADRPPVLKALLSGATGVTNGEWFHVSKIRPLSMTVEGTFVGVVQVYVSNSLSAPADSDNGRPPYGVPLADPQAFNIDGCYEWIKAAVTDYTSGTIECYVIVG